MAMRTARAREVHSTDKPCFRHWRRNQTNGQHSCHGTSADFTNFHPTCTGIYWCQPPVSQLAASPSSPSEAWEPHQWPAQASGAARVQDSSLNLHGLTSNAMRLAPPAVHLHTADLTPVTSIHFLHPLKKTVLSGESMPIARDPTAACRPRWGPVFCRWPAPLDSPVARPSSYVTAHTQPDPHHQPPRLWSGVHINNQCPCNYQCTHSGPQPRLPALAPTTPCMFTTASATTQAPSSWPPQLNVCTPAALASSAICPSP